MIPTYLLTPWWRVLLEKLTDLQLVKKFPAFHRTRRFITALTIVRHLSLSWANPIQSTDPYPTSWRSILLLSTHIRLGLPSGLFPYSRFKVFKFGQSGRHGELCFYNENWKKKHTHTHTQNVTYCVLFGYWRQIIQLITSSRFKSQTKQALPHWGKNVRDYSPVTRSKRTVRRSSQLDDKKIVSNSLLWTRDI